MASGKWSVRFLEEEEMDDVCWKYKSHVPTKVSRKANSEYKVPWEKRSTIILHWKLSLNPKISLSFEVLFLFLKLKETLSD